MKWVWFWYSLNLNLYGHWLIDERKPDIQKWSWILIHFNPCVREKSLSRVAWSWAPDIGLSVSLVTCDDNWEILRVSGLRLRGRIWGPGGGGGHDDVINRGAGRGNQSTLFSDVAVSGARSEERSVRSSDGAKGESQLSTFIQFMSENVCFLSCVVIWLQRSFAPLIPHLSQRLVLGLVWLGAPVQTSYLPLSLRGPRPLPRLPRVFGYRGYSPASFYHQPSLQHSASLPSRLIKPQSSALELASRFRPVPAVPIIRDEAILPDPVLETVPEPVQHQPLPVLKTAPVPVPQPRPAPEPVFSLQRPERPAPVQELAPVEARVEPLPGPLSPQSTSSQWHAQDEAGNHEYGYRNENSAKHETGLAGHSVRGSYSWVDEAGYHEVHYVADEAGFRIVPRPGGAWQGPRDLRDLTDVHRQSGQTGVIVCTLVQCLQFHHHHVREASETQVSWPDKRYVSKYSNINPFHTLEKMRNEDRNWL